MKSEKSTVKEYGFLELYFKEICTRLNEESTEQFWSADTDNLGE